MAIHIASDHIAAIGSIIRFHRKRAGLSRIALADLAGVGKTVVFDIEHGKTTVRLDILFAVLTTLNISVFLDGPIMDQWKESSDEKS